MMEIINRKPIRNLIEINNDSYSINFINPDEISEIAVLNIEDFWIINIIMKSNNKYSLGSFKTKEKALEKINELELFRAKI